MARRRVIPRAVQRRHRGLEPVLVFGDEHLGPLGTGRRYVYVVKRRGRVLTVENVAGVACRIRESQFLRIALDRAAASREIERAKSDGR